MGSVKDESCMKLIEVESCRKGRPRILKMMIVIINFGLGCSISLHDILRLDGNRLWRSSPQLAKVPSYQFSHFRAMALSLDPKRLLRQPTVKDWLKRKSSSCRSSPIRVTQLTLSSERIALPDYALKRTYQRDRQYRCFPTICWIRAESRPCGFDMIRSLEMVIFISGVMDGTWC